MLKTVHAIGATGVSINDIDIAHRVPTRRAEDHHSKPIICKFIPRLAKEAVMNCRREISSIDPTALGLSAR